MNTKAMVHYFQSKRFFYTLCFLLMALADQQLASAPGIRQLLFSRGAFVLTTALILSHWFPAAPSSHVRLAKRSFTLPLILLFGGFVVLSTLSRYDDRWLLLHYLAFFLYYLTPFSSKERRGMLAGMQDGILASFFLVQGLAFVLRPYDVLRYPGMYANTNINALYYVIVYSILLGRILTLPKGILRHIHFLLASCMWSFVLLTMCRSAFLAMFATTILAMFYLGRHSLFLAAKYLGGLVLVGLVCFPLVYGAVRYIPALFHHPIWFYNEYSEEKVHSFDPIDSPKYTSWQDVLEGNFGRLLSLKEGIVQTQAPQKEPLATEETSITEEALASEETPATEETLVTEEALAAEETLASEKTLVAEETLAARETLATGEAPATAEATPARELNSTSARITIYTHYFKSLNLWGHREAENGIQIGPDYFAPHAHNLFLQYFFHFGIPAGILFLLFVVWCGLRLMYLALFPKPSAHYLIPLLPWAGVMVFGLTEMMWRMGQLSFMLMFLLPLWAVGPRMEDTPSLPSATHPPCKP